MWEGGIQRRWLPLFLALAGSNLQITIFNWGKNKTESQIEATHPTHQITRSSGSWWYLPHASPKPPWHGQPPTLPGFSIWSPIRPSSCSRFGRTCCTSRAARKQPRMSAASPRPACSSCPTSCWVDWHPPRAGQRPDSWGCWVGSFQPKGEHAWRPQAVGQSRPERISMSIIWFLSHLLQ